MPSIYGSEMQWFIFMVRVGRFLLKPKKSSSVVINIKWIKRITLIQNDLNIFSVLTVVSC